MKNLITLQNLEANKARIFNSVSVNGKINHPDHWHKGLHIFNFENDNVSDAVSSFLIEKYISDLKKFLKITY